MMRIDPVERHLLLESIFMRYGYDFRQYAEASMNRRIEAILIRFQIPDVLDLIKKILHNRIFFHQILPSFTITTTEFFRDPSFFFNLRTKVFPVLRTHPSLNIWIAGTSTGEEVYSLAVLLKEEKIYDRTTLYATDINIDALNRAKEGIFELSAIQGFTKNYLASGGINSPSDYYTADYNLAIMDPALRENIVFSEHNLATDSVFATMNLILCRNVLIYFSKDLQDRVLNLFVQSLDHRGFLGIGSKESVRFSPCATYLQDLDHGKYLNIFQRKAETDYTHSSRGGV